MRFGTALAAPDLDGFVADGTRCGYLMTCADGFEITPLESPANRGTAIMQGAKKKDLIVSVLILLVHLHLPYLLLRFLSDMAESDSATSSAVHAFDDDLR